MKRFYIVDTTLRDGAQTPGLNITEEKKIEIAKILDKLGLHQIEAGVPAISETERETIRRIKSAAKNSLISVWNRMRKEDIMWSSQCFADIIHISVPSSDLQIVKKLQSDRETVKSRMLECVEEAYKYCRHITIGLEDASRADINFLIELAEALRQYKVDRIRYTDTVGIAYPSKITAQVSVLRQYCTDMEIHCHDDFGMAATNSYAALRCGAKYINTTFLGLGERAGNCDISKFITLASGYDSSVSKDGSMTAQSSISKLIR